MEMEHINENLIKVLIGPEDLEERGIDFLDLIGDQSSIEKFFYSILEEVDVDKHFQESEAVTFQVMPNQDGLELYISRTNFDDMENMVWADEITEHLLEHKRKRKTVKSKKEDNTKNTETNTNSFLNLRNENLKAGEIVKFSSLTDFINLTREIATDAIEADLYHLNDNYYLLINEIADSMIEEAAYNKYLAMLEYGERTQLTQDVLAEYGELIRQDDSLQYFGENF